MDFIKDKKSLSFPHVFSGNPVLPVMDSRLKRSGMTICCPSNQGVAESCFGGRISPQTRISSSFSFEMTYFVVISIEFRRNDGEILETATPSNEGNLFDFFAKHLLKHLK